jgi:uncharacterized repeat protein (TIGR03803 family)
VVCAATATTLPAQTFTTLDTFDGANGSGPEWPLVQATNGDLYGTTYAGGANGLGTVFQITPGGTLTSLYSFCSQPNCADGAHPSSGLVLAANGELYGVTSGGGGNGGGAIFRITQSGALTVVYSFCSIGPGTCMDGSYPYGGLVQDANGDWYGATSYGGTTDQGTVFKYTPSGTLTTIYNFNGTDGYFPSGPLVQATNGYFYGATQFGGTEANCPYSNGCGTVFKMTPAGTLTTLYSFCSASGCPDGDSPVGALVQAANGDLYGATFGGGTNCSPTGCGTIFKITPGGALTTQYSFCAQPSCADGATPDGGLVQAPENGDLYGAAYFGGQGCGANGCGTLFKITQSGALTTLFRAFCPQSDCPNRPTSLIQDTTGVFFGTTLWDGGDGSNGTIFSFAVGLGPFVEILPASGEAGAAVKILGSDLTGATSVSFNGTAAVFEVVSSSLIATKLPAGATTGKVEVVTPGGTLASDLPFRVLP